MCIGILLKILTFLLKFPIFERGVRRFGLSAYLSQKRLVFGAKRKRERRSSRKHAHPFSFRLHNTRNKHSHTTHTLTQPANNTGATKVGSFRGTMEEMAGLKKKHYQDAMKKLLKKPTGRPQWPHLQEATSITPKDFMRLEESNQIPPYVRNTDRPSNHDTR